VRQTRRPRRLSAALPALALLALAVLPAPGAAQGLPKGFHPVAEGASGPVAAHGHDLVWLGDDRFLHLTDLAAGTTSSLTYLPTGVRLQSLAFDGTWLAWCDDRFGNWEAFAMDLHSLNLTRLSKDPGPDTDITVGGGHAAWLRDGELLGTDLDRLAVHRLSLLPGLAFTPSLDGDRLVWSQVVGTERHLAGLVWGGDAMVLTAARNAIESNPVAAAGRVAWRSEAFSGPLGTRGSHSLGTQVLLADFPGTGPLHARNLTGLGTHGLPALGGAWAAWLEAGGSNGLSAVNVETGTHLDVLAGVRAVEASAEYLVIAPSDGPLQARPWQAASAGAPGPGLAIGLAALALVAMLRRR
jgi:MYXO-CTERM domain-containing protein